MSESMPALTFFFRFLFALCRRVSTACCSRCPCGRRSRSTTRSNVQKQVLDVFSFQGLVRSKSGQYMSAHTPKWPSITTFE